MTTTVFATCVSSVFMRVCVYVCVCAYEYGRVSMCVLYINQFPSNWCTSFFFSYYARPAVLSEFEFFDREAASARNLQP